MSNTARRQRRKQQTRLAFEPIDLTSEADEAPKSSLSPARVTFRGAKDNRSSPLKTGTMPPILGAATRGAGISRPKIQKKDGKISWPKSTKRSRLDEPLSNADVNNSTKPTDPPKAKRQRHERSRRPMPEKPAPRHGTDLARRPRGKRHKEIADLEAARSAQELNSRINYTDDSGESSDELSLSRVSPGRRVFGPASQRTSMLSSAFNTAQSSDDESSANDEPPPSSLQLSRPSPSLVSIIDQSNPVEDDEDMVDKVTEHDGDSASEASDDDEPVLPTPRGRRTRRATSSPVKPPENDDDSDDVFGPPVRSSQRQRKLIIEEDSEEEQLASDANKQESTLPTPRPSKRRGADSTDDECNAEDEPSKLVTVSSPSKKLRSRQNIRNRDSKAVPGPHSSQRITRQSGQKKHRTDKEKTMELLRRKRAGEKITELTPSGSEDDEPHGGIYDSNSELEVLSQFDDEEEEEAQRIETVRRSINPRNRDNYDEDFVVEDDEAPLGAPGYGLHDIPLEFTHQAHKPLKEHFKDCIEWMVQKKINPGFNGDDPLYRNSFIKMNDEVRGLASSKFMSSIWKPDFSAALEARPTFGEELLGAADAEFHNHCDACNRNHPTKYIVQFTGKAYDMDTLEDIDQKEDSDEDSDVAEEEDSDDEEVDSKGRVIPPEDKTWYVGRHCKANAETAHALIHWKHALNVWVVDQLGADKHLKPRRLAERDSWSIKKKGKYANAIVDGWEQGSQLKELWRDFKANLETARNSEQKGGRWG